MNQDFVASDFVYEVAEILKAIQWILLDRRIQAHEQILLRLGVLVD